MEKKKRRLYFIPFIIVAVVLVTGVVVMTLWNAIIPRLFRLPAISYWQAIGLFVLCKILFSPFRPGPPHGFRRGGPPWRSKLMDLSEEERENFKREWQRRASENK